MNQTDAVTTVTVTMRSQKKATIKDVQAALDVLLAEGVPDSFEVDIDQRADREHTSDVPHNERPVEHVLRVSAKRAAKAA